MVEVSNSDIVKHVLHSLVNVSGSKTSRVHALFTVKTLLERLQSKYDFLKHIEVYINSDSSIEIGTRIDMVDSSRIGSFIQEIIDTIKSYLGRDSGYFFTREFRDDLGERYHSVIKEMGVDLRLVDLQNELYGMDTTNYKIRDDRDSNIGFVEKAE